MILTGNSIIATGKNPMKISVILFLVIAACILLAGCVGQIKPVGNVTNVTITIMPVPGAANTSDVSNITATPKLKGLLKISLNSWIGEFPVSIDNMSAGVVETTRPLTLMIDEGNHTVSVCCGAVCEQENVTIRFGEQRTVDFSERLKKNFEFIEPTVRITGYFLNGDKVTVNTEFINPTMKTLAMTAEISCGYSYIESRSNNRVGNSAQGQLFATLKPGERITKTLNINLAGEYSYLHLICTMTKTSSK
jgi:hypothetical protein